MKKTPRPIDRDFLTEFIERMGLDGRVVADADLSAWAAENLDGRNRDEQETKIAKDFLLYLCDKLQAATDKLISVHKTVQSNRPKSARYHPFP